MLFKLNGVCQHCAESVSVLLHNGKVAGNCLSCDEEPISVEKIEGVVYVVKNDNQTGVKIGMTTKTVEDRVRQLSSTGVPGSFNVVAIFPSVNPKRHEKKVHEKLAQYRLAKEHFDIEPVQAVLKVYRTLNKAIQPIFYDEHARKRFELELEEARLRMAKNLLGKKQARR